MVFDLSTDPNATTATFTYPADHNYVGSTVYIFDQTRGEGIILEANPDGSVGPSQPLTAVAGNQVVVTFQLEDQSASSCVVLQNGHQDPDQVCQ